MKINNRAPTNWLTTEPKLTINAKIMILKSSNTEFAAAFLLPKILLKINFRTKIFLNFGQVKFYPNYT